MDATPDRRPAVDPAPKPPSSFTYAALAAAALCALLLHLQVSMGSGFGEPDAVAFLQDAILWVRGGIRSSEFASYRYYTSPGYIWFVTRILPGPSGNWAAVGAVLNGINVATSVLVIIPVFLLCRRLAGESAAAISAITVSFIPTFFQGGLYGFPTLPAEFFLLWALYCYDRWLVDTAGARRPWWWLAITCGCLTLAILLKSDVYLTAIALWGLLFFRRRDSWSQAALLAGVGIIPVVGLYLVSHALLVRSPSTTAYANTWAARWPLDIHQLNRHHILQAMKSMGLLTLPVFALALMWLLRQGRWRLALTLGMWAAAPFAFWFFRELDSARHHFPAAVPIAFGVGILLAEIPMRPVLRPVLLGALLAVNYFAFAPSMDTRTTSGRLIASARELSSFVAGLDSLADTSYRDDADKLVFVGTRRQTWYAEAVALEHADSVISYQWSDRHGIRGIDIEYLRGGKQYEWAWLATNFPGAHSEDEMRSAIASYQRDGFLVAGLPVPGGGR